MTVSPTARLRTLAPRPIAGGMRRWGERHCLPMRFRCCSATDGCLLLAALQREGSTHCLYLRFCCFTTKDRCRCLRCCAEGAAADEVCNRTVEARGREGEEKEASARDPGLRRRQLDVTKGATEPLASVSTAIATETLSFPGLALPFHCLRLVPSKAFVAKKLPRLDLPLPLVCVFHRLSNAFHCVSTACSQLPGRTRERRRRRPAEKVAGESTGNPAPVWSL